MRAREAILTTGEKMDEALAADVDREVATAQAAVDKFVAAMK